VHPPKKEEATPEGVNKEAKPKEAVAIIRILTQVLVLLKDNFPSATGKKM
jgi:hypothetical protein